MEIGNLIERSDLQAGFASDRPFIAVVNTTDDFQKRSFAGAISADKTNLFCRVDLEADVSKHGL